MKKTLTTLLFIALVGITLPSNHVYASTESEALLADLMQQLIVLQNKMLALSDNPTVRNLEIAELSIGEGADTPVLIGNKTGLTLPNQTLKVRVSNLGIPNAEAQFKYKMTLLEETDGQDVLTPWTRFGKAGASYDKNGYTNFEVEIEGGLPYEARLGTSRTFYALLSIDVENEVSETGELDNSMFSNTWTMKY